MRNDIPRYIKVLEDFQTELKANISMLKDTTISYQDAWKIAEALEDIDVSDKVYVRRDKLQSAIECALDAMTGRIAEDVVDELYEE
jgi:hypothetical protein